MNSDLQQAPYKVINVMNVIKQESALWHTLKRKYFGANDVASLLGHGFNSPDAVVQSKITETPLSIPLEAVARVNRGKRYEEFVRTLCAQRAKTTIEQTGLRHHPQFKWLTASPDGFMADRQCLVELKVRGTLSTKVPDKYWIQMQVQMAVWGVHRCLYCENVVEEYTSKEELDASLQDNPGFGTGVVDGTYCKLVAFREQRVYFSQAFFDRIVPDLTAHWDRIIDARRVQSKREHAVDSVAHLSKRPTLKQNRVIISPQALFNYYRSNELVDWLDLYGPQERRTLPVPPPSRSTKQIWEQTAGFKRTVFDYVKTHFAYLEGFVYDVDTYGALIRELDSDGIVQDRRGYLAVTPESVRNTKEAMARQHPVILHPCFKETVPELGCVQTSCDMLVLNKHLTDIFGSAVDHDELSDLVSVPECYTPVTVRFGTVPLRSDGKWVSGSAGMRPTVLNLVLAQRALSSAQGQSTVNSLGLIVAYKYVWTCRKVRHSEGHAFRRVAHVDTDEPQYQEALEGGVRWLHRVRTDEYAALDPSQLSTLKAHPNLFPNMTVDRPFCWQAYKLELAESIQELTLRMTVSKREKLFQRGIFCLHELNATLPPPPLTTNSAEGFVAPPVAAVEFFLDFENAGGSLADTFASFPEANDAQYAVITGLLTCDGSNEPVYQPYYMGYLDAHEERRVLTRVVREMKERVPSGSIAPVYHWGAHERTQFNRVFGNDRYLEQHGLQLVDLCALLRNAGIRFSVDQRGYGLKHVAKLLHDKGFIRQVWDESGAAVDDGLDSLVLANRLYSNATSKAPVDTEFFDRIERYNRVDCTTMYEILTYLRAQYPTQEG